MTPQEIHALSEVRNWVVEDLASAVISLVLYGASCSVFPDVVSENTHKPGMNLLLFLITTKIFVYAHPHLTLQATPIRLIDFKFVQDHVARDG